MKTVLILTMVLHFSAGHDEVMPEYISAPHDTIEQCRDEFVAIKARADAESKRPENGLNGISIDWACVTMPVVPRSTVPAIPASERF